MGTQSKGVRTPRLSPTQAKETIHAMYYGNRKTRRAAISQVRRDAAARRRHAQYKANHLAKFTPEKIKEMYDALDSDIKDSKESQTNTDCVRD